MRYALKLNNLTAKSPVHFVDDDEALNAYCGDAMSMNKRFSRRDVTVLKGRLDCRNCLAVNLARKRKAR